MSEAVARYRWERRLLLLALTVGGLWLIGLLGHAGQAHADPVSKALRSAPSAPVAVLRDPIAAAQPAVSALVEKTVPQTVTPAGHVVQTVLDPSVGKVLNQVAAPVVRQLATPVVRAVQPIVTPVVQAAEPIVAPVLDPVAPILDPVAPILDPVGPILAPVAGPVLGHPVASRPIAAAPSAVVTTAALIAAVPAGVRAAGVASGHGNGPVWTTGSTAGLAGSKSHAAAVQSASTDASAPAPSPEPRPLPVPAPQPASVAISTSSATAHQSSVGFDAVATGWAGPADSTPGRAIGGPSAAPREQAYCPSVSPD